MGRSLIYLIAVLFALFSKGTPQSSAIPNLCSLALHMIKTGSSPKQISESLVQVIKTGKNCQGANCQVKSSGDTVNPVNQNVVNNNINPLYPPPPKSNGKYNYGNNYGNNYGDGYGNNYGDNYGNNNYDNYGNNNYDNYGSYGGYGGYGGLRGPNSDQNIPPRPNHNELLKASSSQSVETSGSEATFDIIGDYGSGSMSDIDSGSFLADTMEAQTFIQDFLEIIGMGRDYNGSTNSSQRSVRNPLDFLQTCSKALPEKQTPNEFKKALEKLVATS